MGLDKGKLLLLGPEGQTLEHGDDSNYHLPGLSRMVSPFNYTAVISY